MSTSPSKKAKRALLSQQPSSGLRKITVALVGRPNAGKSRLFNRFVGRRLALVNATPGTTRDWKEEDAQLGELKFTVMDTGGLEDGVTSDSIEAKMQDHTRRAIEHADVVLYMFDARAGITDQDVKFTRWLKKLRDSKGIHLLANKAEFWDSILQDTVEDFDESESPADLATPSALRGKRGKTVDPATVVSDCYALGLGDPIPLSAEHGWGLGDVYNVLHQYAVSPVGEQDGLVSHDEDVTSNGDEEQTPGKIRMAIVGRPNVGKSSLVNCLLGEERLLAGPTPGLTRDSTTVTIEQGGKSFELIDTAGMRRWGSWDLTTPLEGEAVGAAKRALKLAHVVILVVDASGGTISGLDHGVATSTMPRAARAQDYAQGWGLTRQDMSIAEQILAEGRALVVALNKIDTVDRAQHIIDHVQNQLDNMHQGQATQVVPLSALTGHGKDELLPIVAHVHESWNRTISTSKLNNWITLLSRHHPAPSTVRTLTARRGKDGKYETIKVPLRIKYLTQVAARPPTFKLFTNRPQVPETYQRFLINALRKEFGLNGVPIRLHVSVTANPYARKTGGKDSGARKSYAKRRPLYSAASNSGATVEEPRAEAKLPKHAPPSASVRSLQLRMKATGGQLKRVSDKILRKAKRTY